MFKGALKCVDCAKGMAVILVSDTVNIKNVKREIKR